MCKRTSAAPLSGTMKPYPFATSNHLTRPDISTRSTASIADSSGVASKSNRRKAKFLPSKDQPPPKRARDRNTFFHAARRPTTNKQCRIVARIAFGRRCKSPVPQEIVDDIQKNDLCGFGATRCELLLDPAEGPDIGIGQIQRV